MTNKDNPMADQNPQDGGSAGANPEPDEPGEIGWPADASEPGDPSVPEAGSGGAGPSVPEPTHPNDVEPVVEAVVVDEPLVAPVASEYAYTPAEVPEAPVE